MLYDVLIIGGGASGLAAAISAARAGAVRVIVLEKQARVGRRLLSTGNGRCNLLNVNARPAAYFGSHALAEPALNAFDYARAVGFFESIGLVIRAEDNGCAYPACNQASAVLDCLRLALTEAGAKELCGFEAKRVSPANGGFTVYGKSGETARAARVIVCAGGLAAPQLGGGDDFKALLSPLKHAFTPCLPALTPLKTRLKAVAGLKGLRYLGEIALVINGREVARERGEVLFADAGLSGIAAMQLSLRAARAISAGERAQARLSLIDMPFESARAHLAARAREFGARHLDEFLTGLVSKRLGQLALSRAGVQPLSRAADTLTGEEIARVARELTAMEFELEGDFGFERAQVMLGGARADDFWPDTLESRLVPGLYAAGELMDVTGPCGGYNLQWAWASGILAGRSAVNSL